MTTKRKEIPSFQNSMYNPNFSYTYPGMLNTELLQKPKINTPEIGSFARVIQGIRAGQYLNLVQPLTSVLAKGTALCEPTYSQAGSITDRKIETGLFEINLSWCKKEFQGLLSNFNVLGDSDLVGNGLSGYELGGRLRTVILDEVAEQGRQDIWKVYLFGNNSLGSGSTNVYSTIDGIWTKYLDSFASYCVKPVTNALPNAHNSTLTGNQARDTFRLMWKNSSILLKQFIASGRAKMFVTGSMWENYLDSLEDECCVEGSWRLQQDGTKQLFYRGVEVVPLWIADYSLENDTTNPYYDLLRHFAILTIPENNVFGVESAADLNNLELCYDCKSKTTLIQGEMRFGAQFIQCDLVTIAY
jgi:hypothetical protein